MKIVHINDIAFKIPSSWNELTYKDLLKISSLTRLDNSIKEFKIKLFIFTACLKVSNTQEFDINNETCFEFVFNGNKFFITPEQLFELSNIFDFIFKEVKNEKGELNYYIDSLLIKNLIPKIKINTKRFYGPDDALSNILLSEYILAETNYVHYLKTKDNKYLNKLIATLYRKKVDVKTFNSIDFNGDMREKFNSFSIEKRADIIDQLNEDIKHSIFLFYSGSRKYLHKKFPLVFQKSGGKSNDDIFLNMMKLVDSLAGNDVTKNDNVRNSYLYEVMLNLNELSFRNQKKK